MGRNIVEHEFHLNSVLQESNEGQAVKARKVLDLKNKVFAVHFITLAPVVF